MDRYTIFHEDGTVDVRAVPPDAPPTEGDIWSRGVYRSDVVPHPANVRVGEAGIRAWRIIEALTLAQGDGKRAQEWYGSSITERDVRAAEWFYQRYRTEIDREIARDLEPV